MKIYISQKDTDKRFSEVIENTNCKADLVLEVDDNTTFQSFKGFGGAVTESAGYVLSKLSAENQNKILNAYFNKENGNSYIFTRTHLNSCDFSLENWTCVDENDVSLKSFSMKNTNKYVTPVLKNVKTIVGEDLNLLISPWSPPAWMKDNKDMNNGGKILPEYKTLWADYFCKFIQELANENLYVKYVTIQNEPAAKQVWDSCLWTAKEEGDFAVNYLYPAFEKNGLKNIKILVWDHNRDILKERFTDSMSVPGADEAIAGAGFHWYANGHFDQLKYLSESYPSKEFIFTEGCIEGGPQNGKWHTGERYGHNIINDLNNGCNGWIDWNIVLNMEGGPNHVGNYCDSPILADENEDKFYLQSSYFYIGHFSRFIKPNAKRVKCSVSESEDIEWTAFKNTDDSVAFVIMNKSDKDVTISLKIKNEQKAFNLPAHSIITVLA